MAFALSAYKSIMYTLNVSVIFLQYPSGDFNCFVVLNGEFNDLRECNGLLCYCNIHIDLQLCCDVTFSLNLKQCQHQLKRADYSNFLDDVSK